MKKLQKPKKLTFNEIWELLSAKFPELSFWSLRREVAAFPERFGAVRRNPTKLRGRGGGYLFDAKKIHAYAPYQEPKKK